MHSPIFFLNKNNYGTYNISISKKYGIQVAAMLSHLADQHEYFIYKLKKPSSHASHGDNWFYQTQEDVEDQTGLSRKEQDRARDILVTAGFIEIATFYNEMARRTVRHFRMSEDTILTWFGLKRISDQMPERDKRFEPTDCPKGTNTIVQKGQTVSLYNNTNLNNEPKIYTRDDALASPTGEACVFEDFSHSGLEAHAKPLDNNERLIIDELLHKSDNKVNCNSANNYKYISKEKAKATKRNKDVPKKSQSEPKKLFGKHGKISLTQQQYEDLLCTMSPEDREYLIKTMDSWAAGANKAVAYKNCFNKLLDWHEDNLALGRLPSCNSKLAPVRELNPEEIKKFISTFKPPIGASKPYIDNRIIEITGGGAQPWCIRHELSKKGVLEILEKEMKDKGFIKRGI